MREIRLRSHPVLGKRDARLKPTPALSLQRQLIPPTANLDHLDPEIDLDIVTGAPRPARLRTALTDSAGFGGQNAVLAFAAA